MKYIFTYIALFSVLTTTAFAQEVAVMGTSSIPQKREEIKQYIQEKKEELKPQIEEKKEEIKNQIEQQTEQKTQLQILAQERVSKIISYIFEQFDAVLVKFDGIVVRLEARISKLNEQGVAADRSQELLTHAKAKIQESTTLLAASHLALQTAITTEVSKDDIKKSIEDCKTSLKNTQAALFEVVTSLKALDGFEEEVSFE